MYRTASPDTSDHGIEQELVAAGKTAPRVTMADIDGEIVSEHYFTAEDGFFAVLSPEGFAATEEGRGSHPSLALLTFCVLVLRNGCRIVGVNEGPVSPENFDPAIGRKLARAKAIDQCWSLLGFRLRDRIVRGEFETALVGDRPAPTVCFAESVEPESRINGELPPVTAKHGSLMGMFKMTGTLTDAPPGTPPGVATIKREPWQERVLQEAQELVERLNKLSAFLSTDTCLDLPLADRELLVAQAHHMRDYANVLSRRIARF